MTMIVKEERASELVRVLIVDDSRTVRRIYRNALSPYPMLTIVGEASNGISAIKIAQNVEADVMLLDVEMPGMNGISALPRIKKLCPHLSVIIATAMSEFSARVSFIALSLGASDYLTKPTSSIGSVSVNDFEYDLIQKVLALGVSHHDDKQAEDSPPEPPVPPKTKGTPSLRPGSLQGKKSPLEAESAKRNGMTAALAANEEAYEHRLKRDSMSRDSTSREPTSREPTFREPMSSEPMSRQATPQEAKPQEVTPQRVVGQDSTPTAKPVAPKPRSEFVKPKGAPPAEPSIVLPSQFENRFDPTTSDRLMRERRPASAPLVRIDRALLRDRECTDNAMYFAHLGQVDDDIADQIEDTLSRYSMILPSNRRPRAIAIGGSTGAPNLLHPLIRELTRHRLPIFVCQHMPEYFTAILAEQLSTQKGVDAIEVDAENEVSAGKVYIARGDTHLNVRKSGHRMFAFPSSEAPKFYSRPSIAVMVESLTAAYNGAVLMIMLSGIGKDGGEASIALACAGGTVIAQDELSSVVWGLPGFVVEHGVCSAVLDTIDMPQWIDAYMEALHVLH